MCVFFSPYWANNIFIGSVVVYLYTHNYRMAQPTKWVPAIIRGHTVHILVMWFIALKMATCVKAEFQHESKKSMCLSSNNGTIQWEVAYISKKLHLSLLSGAASAEVRYFVYVEYHEDRNKKQTVFSSGSATIKEKDSTDLGMCLYVSNKSNKSNIIPLPFTMLVNGEPIYNGAKTCIEFFILRLNPVVEIPLVSTLSAVLSATLDNDKGLNDVKLYFGPKKELVQASKFMLMARSPVFKIMFEADMQEAQSKEVTIVDITPAVGKEMVAYIYTDKAPNIKSMVEELWFAADKYQLPGLKALCENEFVKQLKICNAAHFLLFAGRYCGDGKFKDYVLSFITKDKDTCSQVMRSEEWKEVKKFPDLVIAVSDEYFDVPAEPVAKRAKCD